MAELLSVQVHVPITRSEDGKLLENTSKTARFPRLKKVSNLVFLVVPHQGGNNVSQ